MNDTTQTVTGTMFGLGMLMFIIVFALAFYVFACFCYKRICEKCGVTPGVLIWIPFVHFIPLLEVAKMPVWTIILLFIPLVNLVFVITLFAKLCIAREKSGWLVIMLFIPIANLIFLPYLAFSE